MARTTWATQGIGAVSLQFVSGDDVRLAEEASGHPAELDLVAQGGCADAEFDRGFGQGEHRLRLVALGLGHEVGLDLAEPSLHRLTTALVGPDPDLVGVEAVRVVPGVAERPLVLRPAIGPLLPGRANLFEFVAKLVASSVAIIGSPYLAWGTNSPSVKSRSLIS